MFHSLTPAQRETKKLIRRLGREWWLHDRCCGFLLAALVTGLVMAIPFAWLWGPKHPKVWPWLITTGEALFGSLCGLCLLLLIGSVIAMVSHRLSARDACDRLFSYAKRIIILEVPDWPITGTIVFPFNDEPFRLDWTPDRKRSALTDAIEQLHHDPHTVYRHIWKLPENIQPQA